MQYENRQQKIVAACILKDAGKILLLRGSQMPSRNRAVADTGYFDVPRFEINFGESPEEVIKNEFNYYFGCDVDNLDVLGVSHHMGSGNAVQIFEIVYELSGQNLIADNQQGEKYFFADLSDLESYIPFEQHKYILNYL